MGRPAPETERSARIEAPRERVYAELAEPARQLGLQPLLVSVRELDAPRAGVRAFEAVERIVLFGRLPWRNRIVVEVQPVAPPGRIDFHAKSPGGVRVTSRFELEPLGDGACRVRETFAVHVPAWLRPARGPILAQAVAAQERLLANLKARLEAPGGGA